MHRKKASRKPGAAAPSGLRPAGAAAEENVSAAAAARRLKRRISAWASRIGVEPKRVQLQGMRKKWASCSTAGRLYFSKDLLQEPPVFQDAVIAHELLHLLVPNHGALFKSFMNAYLPESRGLSGEDRISCSRLARQKN